MVSQNPQEGRGPSLALIVGGLIALFVILGVVLWMNWSADDDSAADNAQGSIVQPAEIPAPQAAEPARPDNDPARDATGDAVAQGRESERAAAGNPAPD